MAKLPTYEELLKSDRSALTTLKHDLDRALKDSEANARKSAKDELSARARELGFEVADLFGNASASKSASTKEKLPAKYRHPENPELTYSGRGRKPGWYSEYVETHGAEKAEKDLSI